MKTKLLLSLATAGVALTSCQNHHYYNKPQRQTKAHQVSETDKIAKIMQMKKDGIISEQEAVQMVNMIINKKPSPAAPAQPPIPVAPVAKVQTVAAQPAKLGLNLTNYTAKPQSLQLRSIGSDSMDRMMLMWEKEFRSFHPNLRFSHEGKGSSTHTHTPAHT